MEGCKSVLFEDPFWLYVLLAMVEAVLLVFWWKDRVREKALRLLYPVGVGIVIYALAALVVTDREKILRAVYEIGRDVTAGRTVALAKYLDEDFRGTFEGEEIDREKALAMAKRRIKAHGVAEVTFKKVVVEVKGKRATLRMLTLIKLQMFGRRDRLPLQWDMEWIKRGKRWKIYRAARPRVSLQLSR
jgi:hypothetical protein